MIVALQEYTAKERYSQRKGRATGSFKHFGQSTTIGDPCSLEKTIEVLNKHEDLDEDAKFIVFMALHLKENRVVFIGMLEHKRKNWMDIVAKQNHN